jgi:hypothetical protein
LIFDNAVEYRPTSSGWDSGTDAEVVFAENDVLGFDFNQRMPHNHWDTLREEESDTNRVFPLIVPIVGGFEYDSDDDETVLEIRLLIKDYVEIYEYDDYDEGDYYITHYFGLSDWLFDVEQGEDTLGGNLIGVARVYVPGKTGSMTVSSLTTDRYLIVLPEGEDVSNYLLDNTGQNLRNAGICDFPLEPNSPSDYVEQYLDYYLKYEEYKVNWNTAVGLYPGADATAKEESFETEWDTYINYFDNYSLPPIAVFITGGTEVINNLPPGNYDIYQTNLDIDSTTGALFVTGDVTAHTANPITVTRNQDTAVTFTP